MGAIALLLAAAAVAYAVARALRVPPVPLLLVAGVGLSRIGRVPADFLEEALILGVTFLLFVAGTELNPRRTRGQRSAALRVGGLQFAALGAAGAATAVALGYGTVGAAYLALALTASSTLVGLRLLRQRRQMFEPSGRLVIGVLLLQDLLVILLIPLITRAPDGAEAVLRGVAALGVLGALAALAWRYLTPRMALLDGDGEAMLLATLGLLAVFIGVAWLLGTPLLVGAFLAGVALSRFPVDALVRPIVAPIADFFSAIFFTALGALIGSPSAVELVHAAVFAALVVALTPLVVAASAEHAGLPARPSIEAGLLLSQTSEISLVIGLFGMVEGQISESAFTVIALTTLITMLLTPLISAGRVGLALTRLHPVRGAGAPPPALRDHVLVLGSGSTGLPLLETLLGANCAVLVVDDDPAVVTRLRAADIDAIRGDAGDLEVLRQAGAREARIITSTIRRPEDNLRVLDYVRGVPTIVRVFDDEDADRIRAHGGTPVLYSEAAAATLLAWVDRDLRSSS